MKAKLLGLAIVACTITGYAQINLAELGKNFEAYKNVWPRTTLHLVTNQNKFTPRDTVWFKAYFVEEDMSPVQGKQLIQLYLLDAQGKVQHEMLFQTNEGIGFSQLTLSDSLSAGIYTLVAYNDWMKNFDPAFFWQKEIEIVKEKALVRTGVPASQAKETSEVAIGITRTGESINIKLETRAGSAWEGKGALLVATSRGKIIHTENTTLSTSSTELSMAANKFSEGVAHFTLIDMGGNLLATRDFVFEPKERITVKIESPAQIQTREKMNLEVSLMQGSQSLEGEFSISVLNASLFGEHQEDTFSKEIIGFHSDVTPWKQVLTGRVPPPRHPFTSVVQKNGIVYSGEAPVPDFTQVMFFLQRSKLRHQTFTTDKGKVGFTIPELYGQDEFFYHAETKGEPVANLSIRWENEGAPLLPVATPFREGSETDTYASFASRCRIINQSYNAFIATEKKKTPPELAAVDFEEEVVAADVTVKVQNYVPFTTMEELIKEIIPSMQSRKAGGKRYVRIVMPEPMTATGDPMYVIDGFLTRNTDFFLSLNPTELVAVKLVNTLKKLKPLGLLGKNGIVIVQTKNGDLREPLDSASKKINGLSLPARFTSPDHQSVEFKQKPNFKSTLYWNPTVKTVNGKATLSFHTTDDVGQMHIQIRGLTKNGQPFEADHFIEVKARAGED